jgi:hypothetical protein
MVVSYFIGCKYDYQKDKPSEDLLSFYKEQSASTNPFEYLSMYEKVDGSVKNTCELIKKQLIHPMEAKEMKDILPEGRYYEDADFPVVYDMLKELNYRNPIGLMATRKVDERLVVACHHHGLLLASILRSKGIPVRIRAGFARYYEKQAGVRFGHVICEVWSEEEQRWMLVDPDRNIVDFSRKKFEFSQVAWHDLRENRADKVKYIAALSEGDLAILHILIQDLSCVVGEEKAYWNEPEFLCANIADLTELNEDKLTLLDTIAFLLKTPDKNLKTLQKLYKNNTFLHPSAVSFADWYEIRTGKSIDEFQSEFK